MKSKRFFLVFFLLFSVFSASFSEEKKVWLYQTEYDTIIQNMMDAQKELTDFKAEQNQELEKFKKDFQNQSLYYKEQEKEAKKKTVLYSLAGFSAGVFFTSGAYILMNR